MLDELGVRRVTLLGHSLGALMAASFSAARRDRVDHLVLASPALGHGIPRGNVLSASAQARIDDLEIEGPEEFAARRAARLVFEPEQNAAHVEAVRRAMSQVRLPGYAQAARMLSAGRLLDDLAQITVPTDVIVGAADAITPPDGARRAHETLRTPWRGRFIELPRSGHAIAQENPAALARLLVAEPETVR
jgi:pimeloyl-ACP methyl ester carboxylesterase